MDPSETVLHVRGRVSALATVSCPCAEHRARFDLEALRWETGEEAAPATPAQRGRIMAALREIEEAHDGVARHAAWGTFYTVAFQAVSDESRRRCAGTEFGSKPERLFARSGHYTREQIAVGAIMIKGAVGLGRPVALKYFAHGHNRLDAANYVRSVAAANPGRPSEATTGVREHLATMPSDQLVEIVEEWARITSTIYPQKWMELRHRCAAQAAGPLTYVVADGTEVEVAVEAPGADPEHAAGGDIAEWVADDPAWICLGRLLRQGLSLDIPAVTTWVLAAASGRSSEATDDALVSWLLKHRCRGGSSSQLKAFRAVSARGVATMVESAAALFFRVGPLTGVGEALHADAALRDRSRSDSQSAPCP